jgi:hypothetical protein
MRIAAMGVTASGAVAHNAFSDEVVALLPHRVSTGPPLRHGGPFLIAILKKDLSPQPSLECRRGRALGSSRNSIGPPCLRLNRMRMRCPHRQ